MTPVIWVIVMQNGEGEDESKTGGKGVSEGRAWRRRRKGPGDTHELMRYFAIFG